jgi:hypothetical protein
MIDMSLVENTAKSAYCDFIMFWDDGGVGDFAGSTHELDVTALLAVLREASCFKTPFHFAER